MIKRVVLSATFLLMPGTLTFGQSTSPSWLSFLTTRIKPDMRQEYEGYMKEISAAYKKGGAPFRAVTQNAFGDLNEYTSVTQLQNLASLEQPSLLVKALGEDNWAHLSRSLARCSIESQRVAAQARDDLSIRKATPGTYTYGLVSHTLIAPGHMPDYEGWLKSDYLPALKKAGVEDYWVNRIIYGGNLNEVSAVRWLKSAGDLDNGPILTKAVGAEAAAKINAKAAPFIRSQRLVVMRVRTDLSYLPPMPAK